MCGCGLLTGKFFSEESDCNSYHLDARPKVSIPSWLLLSAHVITYHILLGDCLVQVSWHKVNSRMREIFNSKFSPKACPYADSCHKFVPIFELAAGAVVSIPLTIPQRAS